MEILRQIQSVKSSDGNKTMTFGGKTVNISQVQRQLGRSGQGALLINKIKK